MGLLTIRESSMTINIRNLRFSGILLAVAATIFVAGCEAPKRNPQVVASPDKVSLMLAEAADKASNSLQTLAAVEQTRSPGVAVQPITNAPDELMRAMTVTWVGPPEQIMRRLADRASYNFLALGNRPPVPLVVNIDVQNKPVIEILRDIGLQLGVRADVKVDAERQMIELHYAPVTGVGG
jgi:defect-in-organelle-trafficking protein DotD